MWSPTVNSFQISLNSNISNLMLLFNFSYFMLHYCVIIGMLVMLLHLIKGKGIMLHFSGLRAQTPTKEISEIVVSSISHSKERVYFGPLIWQKCYFSFMNWKMNFSHNWEGFRTRPDKLEYFIGSIHLLSSCCASCHE